jgi:ABC-type transporter Mla maintaining outer membrane lipid asymmetry ATPase subunit MlaF
MNSNLPLLEVKNLHVSINDNEILKNFNLKINQGEILQLWDQMVLVKVLFQKF